MLDTVAVVIRGLGRGEDDAGLERDFLADETEALDVPAINRRKRQRREDDRGVGLAAGYAADLIGLRLQRQDPHAARVDAVFRFEQRVGVMRRGAELRDAAAVTTEILVALQPIGIGRVRDTEDE